MAAEHARALAAELPGLAIEAGCLRGEPAVERVAAGLPKPAIVVPLLVAEGYILDLLRRRLAGIEGLRVTRPLGVHPGLAVIAASAAEASAGARGWRAEVTTLLLVGHGTPRHPSSAATAEALAGRLERGGRFRGVATAFLEQPPFLAERLEALAAAPVVVVGFFVDSGPHGRDDVEAAIEAAAGPVAYTGPLGALPAIRPLLRELAEL